MGKVKTCEICGREFGPRRRARFCSPRCKSRAWRRRMSALRESAGESRSRRCRRCGRGIVGRRRDAKYCSRGCEAAFLRERRDAEALRRLPRPLENPGARSAGEPIRSNASLWPNIVRAGAESTGVDG